MKREFIEDLLKKHGMAEDKLKDIVDGIMSENGKDIEAQKAKTTAKESELATAQQTITHLQETVKKFDGKDPEKLTADLTALQEKYNTDIAAERKKYEDMGKTVSLKSSLEGKGVADPDYFIYKHGGLEKFAFNDQGQPIGLDDIIAPYKESSPSLFKADSSNNNNGAGNGGSVVVNSGGSHGGSGSTNTDNMSDDEFYAHYFSNKNK